MSYDKLTVVTSARWLADDLAAAGTIDVAHTLGLDTPDLTRSALWCSGAWALRLAKSGLSHTFLAAGPDWMSRVPRNFLRRKVWTGFLGDMPYMGTDPMFYKLAEHKHSGIPAGLHLGRGSFRRQAYDAFDFAPGIEELRFVGSEPMAYAREYRCFIAHGKVTAASFYLSTVPGINGSTVTITWDAFDAATAPDNTAAAAFAQEVVDAMGTDQPPGYTLDVGEDATGTFSVIEANAAWSSNIYHAPAAGVIESVLAAQLPGNDRWAWKPDALFLERARPLPGGSL